MAVGRSPPTTRSRTVTARTPTVAVQPRTQPEVLDDDAAPPLQRDRPPRPDGRRPRREAWDATQEHRAKPAEVVVRDQPGPPTRPRAALRRQLRGQCPAADRQHVVAGHDAIADIDDVLLEHGFARRDQAPVQEHIGERGDAAESQDDLLAGRGRRGRERRPEPPVLAVQVAGLEPGGAQGPRRGPGHRRRHPCHVAEIVRRRALARRRGRCLPAVDDRDQDMALDPASDGRRSRRHAVRRRLRRARQAPRSRPGSVPSWRRSDRTAAGARA